MQHYKMMTNSKLLCNILLLTMLGELSAVTREMITCITNCLVIYSISSYVNNIEMLITQVVPGTNITVGHRNKTKCV